MSNDKRFSLAGKVALITGGSKGIGEAIAVAFAEHGADVALASRKMPDLENVAARVRALGRKAFPVAVHMGRMDQVEKLAQAVHQEFGKIDILVNNAATSPAFTTILDAEEKLWDSIMNLNLKGLYFLTQAVARMMKNSGGGSVINISSIDAYRPQHQVGIYSISKAAVNMATQSAALELAEYAIRVNGIAPGATRTKIFEALFVGKDVEQEIKKLGEKFPLGRIAETDDIVGAALFFASDASRFITGQTMVVDGGYLLK
jgi:NAD(P)-dependent dehydrogenase (short-subunit alcohol dehydrogenase family)